MSRLIFLTDELFPKSGAVSGYIENMIILSQRAFPNANIVLLSRYNNCEESDLTNISYVDISADSKAGIIIKMIRSLNNLKILKSDIIFNFISKPENQFFLYLFFHRYKKLFISYFGEWFDLRYFGINLSGIIRYLRYYAGVAIRKKYDNAVVVSTFLRNNLKIKNSICIPPMCKMSNESVNNLSKKRWSNIKFIYPGADIGKDRIERIVEAFSILSQSFDNIELHLTGIRNIKKFFSDRRLFFNNDDRIVVHGWLNNKEYNDLLSKMDFCIIIRDDHRISQANFPSKIPEIMKYGIIPIVSSVGDYTDIYLRDCCNSFIVKGAKVSDFVSRINTILNMRLSELDRIHNESAKCAFAFFNIDNWIKPLIQYIRESFAWEDIKEIYESTSEDRRSD